VEGVTDQAGEKQKVTTFDDLFSGLFQEPTSTASPIEYDLDEGKALVPLEKLPAFHSLVSTASAQGFVSHQEVITQLPERYIERFISYAIDHEIVILETDPLAELAKEKLQRFEVEEVEEGEEEELNLFRLYQYDAWRFPLLSPEEEILLAKKIEQAQIAHWRLSNDDCDSETQAKLEEQVREGEESRLQFIEGNLRLVMYWARRYQDHGLELMDIIQEGNLGLMKAVDKFDHRQGCRFSTYASWWIKQAITRGIAEQSRLIRLPAHMYETVRRFEVISEKLAKDLGRDPTLEEVAFEMDLLTEEDRLAIEKARATNQQLVSSLKQKLRRAISKVRRIVTLAQKPLSFDMVIVDDVLREDGYLKRLFGLEKLIHAKENGICLRDLLENELLYDPSGIIFLRLLREQLEEALEALTKRQRRVLELRFGLKDGQGRSLEEIGQEFGLTRERIRQIEAAALRRLGHPSRKRKLRDYVDWQVSKREQEEATEGAEGAGITSRRDSVIISEGEVLQFDDLKLNTTTRQAWRGERLLDLTAREFDFLVLFVRHPRQVLTHNLIYERLWGCDFGGESNVIGSSVSRLRAKLEAQG
jgi:RNA polymerase sigma factor (sigma-70 family)